MTEMVLETKTLPEYLFRLLKVEKVKVRELDGEIHLIVSQNNFARACAKAKLF